ncbi:Lactose permease [Lachnellula suecica]|uniref:Lactose permease n=1 Tax=Lachnellula suecica TaxID=602035 RepID=A0A8T9C3M6_9HELO|nr:Lactose permease [Lachnellula suecica]
MVGIGIDTGRSLQGTLGVAQAEAPEFEKVSWYSNSGLRKLYFWAAVLCVASATTGYDGPYMADWWGRKTPIAVGCVLMVLGGFIGAFCNGYGMYVGGRFILGFGNSLSQLSSPVLLTEICHPQHRARITAVYNCLWNLGALCKFDIGYDDQNFYSNYKIVVAWIAWATMTIHNDWSWRTLTILQVLPAVIQLTFIYLGTTNSSLLLTIIGFCFGSKTNSTLGVPESPRWHIANDRPEEALATLAYYHANGDTQNTTVQFEYQEIKETLRLEFEFKKTSSYMDFLKTRGNRYRLAILLSLGIISQYSGNALFSNYMNLIYNSMGITSQGQKIPLNGGQTLLALVVSVGCAFLVDRVGRRPLFLTSTVGMVLMFLAWTITASRFEASDSKNMAAGTPQVVFVWVFGIFYSLAWSGLLVAYALEILPYKLRAKGLMIMNLTVQCALVLGNYTNPIAWEKLPHHYDLSLIYTVWIFVELIFVYFFYVETRGPTLEELAKIFDGDEAEVAHLDLHKVEKELHGHDGAGLDEKRVVLTEERAV